MTWPTRRSIHPEFPVGNPLPESPIIRRPIASTREQAPHLGAGVAVATSASLPTGTYSDV
jgi:hypothetical protein